MSNKIKYGLKNVHYAVATIAADGSATYGAPAPFPGAVSLSMEPQGETTPFYADNVVYWTGVSNNGYQGDLEMARVIDDFKKDILGYVTDAKGVLLEDANAQAVHFALLFQFEGDVKATRHVLYNCTATRPGASGNTKAENADPQTESVSITATSVYFATINGGTDLVKAETVEGSDATTYNGWFESVYTPTAPANNG